MTVMRSFALILLLSTPIAYGDLISFIERPGQFADRDHNSWGVDLGVSAMNFTGQFAAVPADDITLSRSFSQERKKQIVGPSLWFRRSYRITGRYVMSTGIGLSYFKNFKKEKENAEGFPDLSQIEYKSEVYGVSGKQDFSIFFNFAPGWSIAPFVSFQYGIFKAEQGLDYNFNNTLQRESVSSTVDDTVQMYGPGGGIKVLASNGFFSFLSYQRMSFKRTDREVSLKAEIYPDLLSAPNRYSGARAVPESDQQNADIITLGAGYVF